MLQYVLWAISFVTLWITIVWLNFLYTDKPKKQVLKYPKITFGIPAFNEAGSILKTLKSLLAADYPLSKKEIIVVDDGSTDGTAKVGRNFLRQNPTAPVKIITKKNGGKASALNLALNKSKSEFFAVVDADSRITPESIKKSLANFTSNKVGARNTANISSIFFFVKNVKSIHCSIHLNNKSAYGNAPKMCVKWSHCMPTGEIWYHPKMPPACSICPIISIVNIGVFILNVS